MRFLLSIHDFWYTALGLKTGIQSIESTEKGGILMRMDRVLDGETLQALSARLGVPGCMLLRANRLFSPAWLLAGREIAVPDGAFCLTDDFICPVAALHVPAWDRGFSQIPGSLESSWTENREPPDHPE